MVTNGLEDLEAHSLASATMERVRKSQEPRAKSQEPRAKSQEPVYSLNDVERQLGLAD